MMQHTLHKSWQSSVDLYLSHQSKVKHDIISAVISLRLQKSHIYHQDNTSLFFHSVLTHPVSMLCTLVATWKSLNVKFSCWTLTQVLLQGFRLLSVNPSDATLKCSCTERSQMIIQTRKKKTKTPFLMERNLKQNQAPVGQSRTLTGWLVCADVVHIKKDESRWEKDEKRSLQLFILTWTNCAAADPYPLSGGDKSNYWDNKIKITWNEAFISDLWVFAVSQATSWPSITGVSCTAGRVTSADLTGFDTWRAPTWTGMRSCPASGSSAAQCRATCEPRRATHLKHIALKPL